MTIIISPQNSFVLCHIFSTGCPFFPCLVHCAPGEFLESNILCKPCPVGSYSPGVVMNKTVEKCSRLAMQCIIFCLMIMKHTMWLNSQVHVTERQRIIYSAVKSPAEKNNRVCGIIIQLTDHNYNKILKADWLSTVLISALIGQCNRAVCVIPKQLDSTRHRMWPPKWLFPLLAKNS